MSNGMIEPLCYNFCPKSGDYIVFKYNMDSEDFDIESLAEFHNQMVDKFCNNSVITIPTSIKIEYYPKEEIIPFLEDMIKKIKDDEITW